MSPGDFERCTPSEFDAVYRKWKECEDSRERAGWERMRMHCICILQVFSKKRLEAGDVMSFPWDERNARQDKREECGREELLRRYEAAKRRRGLI